GGGMVRLGGKIYPSAKAAFEAYIGSSQVARDIGSTILSKAGQYTDDAVNAITKGLDKVAANRMVASISNTVSMSFDELISKVPGTIKGKYDAVTPGNLIAEKAKTFAGGKYAVIETTEDVVLYRVWSPGQSSEFGGYWSFDKPMGSLQSS